MDSRTGDMGDVCLDFAVFLYRFYYGIFYQFDNQDQLIMQNAEWIMQNVKACFSGMDITQAFIPFEINCSAAYGIENITK